MSKSQNMSKMSQNDLELTKLTHGNIFSSQDHYKHPQATQCHVKATEPCVYFYKIRLLMVDIMQRFSTQRYISCKAYMTCESIYFCCFPSIDIPFSDLNMVHEMPLWQKEAYAPPLESIRAKHS